MAATGKTPILLYGSTTATNQPSAGNLTNSSDGCEIAINVADKNLFFKDSTNTVNTVPIRQSSASSDGWLSSTDWSTFNSKQPAGTYVTSVTGTAPVVSSGGTTPAISMAAANGSTNGYLTSTDWTAFNSKVSSQWTTSGSDIYYYTGNVGVGLNPSSWATFKALEIGNAGSGFWSSSISDLRISANIYYNSGYKYAGSNLASMYQQAAGNHFWYTAVSGTAGNPVSLIQTMQIASSGGVSIDSTTDAGTGNLLLGTGNLVIGTSGKGIDFSATPDATATSELLADYEEGTWTPSQGAGLTVVGSFSSSGTYTKVGRQVTIVGIISGSTSVAVSAGGEFTSSLPYAPANAVSGGAVNSNADKGSQLYVGTIIYSINAIAASASFRFSATYFV